jgi:lipopolysaccharide/colanic/teichoic acid biosynthesis glycosyltransferase
MGVAASSRGQVHREVDWAVLERSLGDSASRRRHAGRRVAMEGRLRLMADASALLLVVVFAALASWDARPHDRLTWLAASALGVLLWLGAARSYGAGFGFKYAVDRVLAGVFVLVLAPVLAATALAVLIASGRPVLFRQRRVGCDGRVFEILKFRTMRGSPEEGGEANAAWAASVVGADTGAAHRVGADERRTPLGAFLRRSSLDELPQLFNVLRGDMSLIGPRPELVHYVERFDGAVYRYADRHRVRSGITGWAQVNGLRGDTSLADRVEWDNHYIENWSPWLDARIALRSLRAVLGHRNAG